MTIKDLAMGAAAGATLAVVATLYFSGAAATPAPVAAPVAAVPTASPLATASAAASAGPGSASAARPAAIVTSTAPAVACPPAVAAADPRKAASAAAPAAVRVDVPAVALSEEHAKMLLAINDRPPSLPELHARFAGEPLDPAWSQQMEAQLRQSLQEAGVQKGFDLLAVECRRTLCELRLFGTGPESGRRWGAVTGKLSQQSWWGSNFSGISSSTSGPEDRSVIATVLHRAKR